MATFLQFDENGDGVISREELSKVFIAIDPEHWTEARLQRLMDAADKNNDGHINYEEFVKWLLTDNAEWNVDRAVIQLNRKPSFQRGMLVMDSRETVRDTELMRLTVDQSEGAGLGVKVDSSDGKTLLVKQIKSGGLIDLWNTTSCAKQVCTGDRILEVNDLKGDSKRLMKELKKRLPMDLVIARSEAAQLYVSKITDTYDIDLTWIEEGAYSRIMKIIHRDTKATYAVKSMHKQHTTQEHFESMASILKGLDHPNIVKLFEVYEDCLDFHLVIEFCSGGELFERVLRENYFTERQAAAVIAQILAGVGYLHSRGICHRHLRTEHVLLEAEKPIINCNAKLIDFRSARRFHEGGTLFRTRVGQVVYMPPEMAKGRQYDYRCDIWSCGVMLYMALCGYPPFLGENDGETLRLVQRADLVFPEGDWKSVSDQAKDLVGSLLAYTPSSRPPASQATIHEWIKSAELGGVPFPLHFGQKAMREYCGMNKLKKAALHAIAQRLKIEEIQQLYDMFTLLDKNGDRLVTFYELKDGLDRLGTVESLTSLKRIFEEADVDGSRQIDYTEFLAATLDRKRYLQDDALRVAFQVFDRDKSGQICRKELAQVLGLDAVQAVMDAADIERVLEECDVDGNGFVDFEEFMLLMRRESNSPPDFEDL